MYVRASFAAWRCSGDKPASAAFRRNFAPLYRRTASSTPISVSAASSSSWCGNLRCARLMNRWWRVLFRKESTKPLLLAASLVPHKQHTYPVPLSGVYWSPRPEIGKVSNEPALETFVHSFGRFGLLQPPS
jgi:hypothetical protein